MFFSSYNCSVTLMTHLVNRMKDEEYTFRRASRTPYYSALLIINAILFIRHAHDQFVAVNFCSRLSHEQEEGLRIKPKTLFASNWLPEQDSLRLAQGRLT
jgi:hypothetical protein